MKDLQAISGRMEEIISFAKANDNEISLFIVQDIIKNKKTGIDEDLLNMALYQIKEQGIKVLPADMDEGYKADTDEPDKFIPSDVNITQVPTNISNIMDRLENREFDLSPAFQRNGGLWDEEKQSRLIESLMLKIPLPAFYFDASKEDEWVVIDGLQRMTAFHNFLVGKKNEEGVRIKERFCGLEYMADFNGKTFDDLPRQYIRRIKETPIVAYFVEKGTPEGIVYNIFERINTGGVKLEKQEIRHAMYNGKATALLERLAESALFIQATQHAISTERMEDREYVNRFIAFAELDYRNEYEGNVDDFLRKALKTVNQYDDRDIARIEQNFYRAMKGCRDIFGKYAFRKYNNDTMRRGPINKALFESWGVVLSELSQDKIDILVKKREELLRKQGIKMQDNDFSMALKGGSPSALKKRIEIVRRIVEEVL